MGSSFPAWVHARGQPGWGCSMLALREYQSNAIQALRVSLVRGHRRPVLVMPTGSGKSVVAAEMARMATAKRNRVLILAPRRELVFQLGDKIEQCGLLPGYIMAGEHRSLMADVQIASFDTLHARCMRGDMPLPKADMLLIDEAHTTITRTRKDIIEAYGNIPVVSFTATPARGDGRGLGEIYDDLVLGPTIPELIAQDHLVPCRYYAPTKPDLERIKLDKDGDYQQKQLGKRMNTPQLIGDVVDNWLKHAHGKTTLVYCVDRAHSRAMRDAFARIGVQAEHLDGETDADERRDIIERVRSGETTVVCNVFVLTYGTDIPGVECVVLDRPTKNITLFLQMIGRGMRPADGKAECTVIDHAGAVAENGFADEYIPWSLDSETKVKDRQKQAKQEQQEPKEIECADCHFVFKARRDCPNCGNSVIQPSDPIPHHEAELVEASRDGKKANRKDTWEQKRTFYAQVKGYVQSMGKKPGYAAHLYRRRYTVWPNDQRVKSVQPMPCGTEVSRWITHTQIRYAKRQEAA